MQSKDYHALIRKRVSVRNYDPTRPVERECLLRILEAGRIAPSAANRQPWKFIIVESPEELTKVRDCYHRDWFKNAPQILIVVINNNESWTRKNDDYCSAETDATIAMDHMILAAETEGVATCWIAAFDLKILRNALNLADNETIYAITPLGYPINGYEKPQNKQRKQISDIVEFR